MRNIINISLPKELNRVVERAMREGKFASKSEFFRNLLRMWEEEELLKDIEASRREFAAGKGPKEVMQVRFLPRAQFILNGSTR
ncbi:MAG: hypothetical protein HYT82_02480 [Candidatus Harrisonbacteria bacterium]|nr:hypothetical protein [Candidatus Harrisonbacteria bacterium]